MTRMFQEMVKIQDYLDKQKNRLYKLKNQYISIIYKGRLDLKSVKQIHKELYLATINSKASEKSKMFHYAYRLSSKLAKVSDKFMIDNNHYSANEGDLLAVSLYATLKHWNVFDNFKVMINNELMHHEGEIKTEMLENLWQEGRKSGHIFYVASSHADCAKDHQDYQGKIYVDAYFNRHNKELCDFIRENQFRTVQWITGKPVYFITRPHCRHYFKQYTFEQIRDGRYHIPHRKKGMKTMQTPRGATIEQYKERLETLKALYNAHQSRFLKEKILKTRILIQKWEDYYKRTKH